MTIGLFRTAQEAAQPCPQPNRQVFVVTGAYGALGKETVRALLGAGAATVVVGGRNPTAQAAFLETLEKDGVTTIGVGEENTTSKTNTSGSPEQQPQVVDGSHTIDLADLASVQQFANYVKQTYPQLECVICNAGVMNTPFGQTAQHFETQMGVNVIGHFLLCKILAPQTKRQVWVSSFAHTVGGARIDVERLKDTPQEDDYDGWKAYQQSKLGNILLAKEFSKRYATQGMQTASLHPGVIYSGLYASTGLVSACQLVLGMVVPVLKGNVFQVIPKFPSAGAATTVHCTTIDTLVNGGYYSNCQLAQESKAAKNEEDAAALFDYCDQVTKDFQ